jgi:cytochrome c-type biogenesis protein CcmH
MTFLLALLYAAIALAAIGFAVWPVLCRKDQPMRARALLAGAIVALMLAVSGGAYVTLGQPQLALRSLEGPQPSDLPSLVAALSVRMRERPDDVKGWRLLGSGYLTLNDPDDAAKAFAQAIALSNAAHKPDAELYSAYGEALTQSATVVTEDAEKAFRAALAINPKDQAARYYLGQAYAMHGQNDRALAIWQSLLADAPANAPWRGELIDRVAALKAASGQAPDISAMVAGLAQRLKTNPGDSNGWQRLVHAYAVLGDKSKAADALAQARNALKTDSAALAALDAEARSLGLQK